MAGGVFLYLLLHTIFSTAHFMHGRGILGLYAGPHDDRGPCQKGRGIGNN